MSACVPTPVSTAFSTATENVITTTYSLSTSAIPPVLTTYANPYCEDEAVLLDSTVCLRTGTRTITETLQPPLETLYTIPYETTIPVTTLVPIGTFYSDCSPPGPGSGGNAGPGPGNGPNPGPGDGNGNGNSTNGNNGGGIYVPPGYTLMTTSVLVYTNDTPQTSMYPSVITLPNGQVTTTLILTTITPKQSQVYVPTTALVEQTGNSKSGAPSGGHLGVIIGVVIGGFIGLCLMILAFWYVRRKRKAAYDEILYGHEKQLENHEAHRQAIERSKDPTRRRDSDPKPAPYHYGSLLSRGSRTQSSTSTGVALSQNPFEGTAVGNRATYLAPVSPLLTTVSVMSEFGIGSGLGVVAGVDSSASGVGRCDGANDLVNPSTSSIFDASGSVPTMDSAPTLDSSSGRSSDLDYLRPHGSADEFVEVDIGGTGAGVVRGSRVTSPPPHLSMSFGSWNSGTSKGRGSGVSKQSDRMNPGPDPGPSSSDGSLGSEQNEGQRLLPQPQQRQKHKGYTLDDHTTTTSVQTGIVRQEITSHLRKKSGSPVSWASPARGTLFIVNQRDSEDL